MTRRGLEVVEAGALTTVQDAGRPGQASLGIGHSGACDRRSYALADRLVGNPPGSAQLEVTFGGLVLRASCDLLVATTGARCSGSWPHLAPTYLRAGDEVRLGRPVSGVRTYLAVRGGFDVPPVLGSRSTDVLAGLGPPAVAAGDLLPVGPARGEVPGVDVAPVAEPAADDVVVPVTPGPRRDWFPDDAFDLLVSSGWTATSDSNRVGVRLDGPPLERSRSGELPSEGMVRGALQVPPSGLPVLFLADHPVTGGYPVLAYVDDDDVDRCGQVRPGQRVRFRASGGRRGRSG
jgi:biotin-dependent carboxylase-like uncharacterized protein